MSWFDKHKWSRNRVEEERKALAASVEAMTTSEQVQVDDWSEFEEEEKAERVSGPALIPPRLRLQSRPLPVVHLEATKHRPVREAPGEVPPLSEPSRRLGRSTKVRLQTVSPVQEPVTERVPVLDVPEQRDPTRETALAQDRQPLVRRAEAPVAIASTYAPASIVCGNGLIEAGQEDSTVHNARISAQSVVSIMLAGNPGPVVVHYVSLQPRAGFTLHMSAPVSATTPFTYAVWLF